jgi:hypothetical protein
MIRYSAYCTTCRCVHFFDDYAPKPHQSPECQEGEPPTGHPANSLSRVLTIANMTVGFHEAAITVESSGPDLRFGFEVDKDGGLHRDDCRYSFAQDVPLVDFLTKLGLHREAVAGGMLEFIRSYIGDVEFCYCGDMSLPLGTKCQYCVAVALIAKADNGATS